jgi:hypothetical protein
MTHLSISLSQHKTISLICTVFQNFTLSRLSQRRLIEAGAVDVLQRVRSPFYARQIPFLHKSVLLNWRFSFCQYSHQAIAANLDLPYGGNLSAGTALAALVVDQKNVNPNQIILSFFF